jgi:hypothetical protein
MHPLLTKPSWYIVGAQDRLINPDLQRSFASRMKAKTSGVTYKMR